jgi:DnaJ-class molecular chaperone
MYLVIHPKDSEYEINESDLTKEIEITPPEAVLGCKKEIKTLHGNITIQIPQMTSTGKMLRLKNLGLPKKSGGFGNLNAKSKIVLPEKLTTKQLELYKQV